MWMAVKRAGHDKSRNFVRRYIAFRFARRWLLLLGGRVIILQQTRKEIALDGLNALDAE
jgi:hypothetical protein